MTDYVTVEKWLGKANIDFSASFSHGLLTAYCCNHRSQTEWQTALLPEYDPLDVIQQTAIQQLEEIKNEINEALADASFSYQLLLDDATEEVRDTALSTREWASGLFLGIKNIELETQLSDEDSLEFIQDLQRIAAMELPEESDLETLSDLIEIQEYCRIGAIGLYLTSWQI